MAQIIREVYWKDGAKLVVSPTMQQKKTGQERDITAAFSGPDAPKNPEHKNHYRALNDYLIAGNRITGTEYDEIVASVSAKHPGKTSADWIIQNGILVAMTQKYVGKINALKIKGSTLAEPTIALTE